MARNITIEYPVSLPYYFISFIGGKKNKDMEVLFRSNLDWKGKLMYSEEENALTLRSMIFWWSVLRSKFKPALSKCHGVDEKRECMLKNFKKRFGIENVNDQDGTI